MGLEVYDDIEKCFEGGWSDGLPVIPPYGSLVQKMLDAMGWDATEVVGTIESQDIEIMAEHLAAAAVMAGCKPEYGTLLRSVSLALVDPRLRLSAVEVTTGGVAPLVIVSGPVVEELEFEFTANPLGANARPNATVGRFAQLVRLFCGRGGGSLQSHGTMGHPGRLTYCVAERPDHAWPSFHTQFGLPEEASAVTLVAGEGPNSVNNHYGDSGQVILETIADCLAHAGTTNFYYRSAGYVIVIGTDHMDLIGQEFTRDAAASFLIDHAVRDTDELDRLGRIVNPPRRGSKVELGAPRAPIDNVGQLSFLETGGPGGRFSATIPRWVGNREVVSVVVDQPSPVAEIPG